MTLIFREFVDTVARGRGVTLLRRLNALIEAAIPLIDLSEAAVVAASGPSQGQLSSHSSGGGSGSGSGSGSGASTAAGMSSDAASSGGGSGGGGNIAQRLCASCGLIWMPTKMKLWSKALQDSGGAAGLDDISINRVIAAEM